LRIAFNSSLPIALRVINRFLLSLIVPVFDAKVGILHLHFFELLQHIGAMQIL
jgi:hypothetical protein